MNFLKILIPLPFRRFLKRIILSISLATKQPVWVFFAAGSRKSPSSARNRYSFKAQGREQKKNHFLILVPWFALGGSFQMTKEVMRLLSKKDFSFSVRFTREPGSQMGQLEPYTYDIGPLVLSWKRKDNQATVSSLLSEQKFAAVILIDIDPDSYFFLPHFRKQAIPVIDWLQFHTDTVVPYRQFITKMGKLVDNFLVANQEMKQLLLSADYLGNKAKVSVIANGVDTFVFNPLLYEHKKKTSLRKKLGIPAGSPVVSYISRFDELKNPLGAIKISNKILKLLPEAYVLMAGDGHLLKRTKKKAQDMRLGAQVKFLGFQDDVRPVLAITSVLIAPSMSESFGLSVAEAMAMEIPVVVSDVGGLKGLVGNGVHGYRLDPIDLEGFAKRVVELIKNRKKASHFGKAARQQIKNEFPLTKIAGRFEKLLNNI